MAEAMEQLSRLANSASTGTATEKVRGELMDENGQLKRRIQDLVLRSSVDAMTGCFNRGHFDEQLIERAAVARAGRKPLGVLFLDADHFKKINDTYGHAAGDAVLKRLGSLLTQTIRGNDIVARYGGEEFVVLLAEPCLVALQSLSERLRAAVEKERIAIDGGAIRVTVSIGGALANGPHQENCAERLLALADAALYSAKNAGRNRVEIREQRTDGLETAVAELLPVEV
jgi:diguanylate cyclase (GGDEF)-like protein